MKEPNIQNTPIRTDEGHRIRLAFAVNSRLREADYSQAEFRAMVSFRPLEDSYATIVNGVRVPDSLVSLVMLYKLCPEDIVHLCFLSLIDRYDNFVSDRFRKDTRV